MPENKNETFGLFVHNQQVERIIRRELKKLNGDGNAKPPLNVVSGAACTVDFVDAAVEIIREHVNAMPAGIGVDAPLWWSSGKGGLRKADQWIRRQYGLHPRNVQAVNSLWGSVLAQGMMFVTRIREVFPSVNISETHPKAVLVALGREPWKVHLASIRTTVTLDSKPDHERDAIISAVAAREGFEGRWKRDLAVDRFPSEQNPSTHWLAPVHYFWPA